jgi:predicted small lipoprotein YifL
MKKFYLGFSTLICLAVLFSLASCTTDSPLVEGDTIGKADVKNEIPYYTPKKVDEVLATENVTANAVMTEEDDIIDPDWKILIGHITGGTGSTN